MTPVDACPRCKRPFTCGIDGPAPCACTGVAVPAVTLERLRREHLGCLCPACLRAEASRDCHAPAPRGEPAPPPG